MISRTLALVPTFIDYRFAVDKIIYRDQMSDATVILRAIDIQTQRRVIVKIYLEKEHFEHEKGVFQSLAQIEQVGEKNRCLQIIHFSDSPSDEVLILDQVPYPHYRYIVFCGHKYGTLLDLVYNLQPSSSLPKKIIGVELLEYLFKQIIMAVQQLHKMGWAHREISLNSFALDETLTIKLMLFSTYRPIQSEIKEKCGIKEFRAPELEASIRTNFVYGSCNAQLCDIFAVGKSQSSRMGKSDQYTFAQLKLICDALLNESTQKRLLNLDSLMKLNMFQGPCELTSELRAQFLSLYQQ